ncbi:MAG TPA: TIM barrel protein, partial [Algoriphagus sp.]|nr:TIM barrel protein [Algoriphagus sp.]
HGYEFHPHGDGNLFDLMIQKTDSNYVSFEMDILWTFFPGEDPVYYLEKYGDRFKLMHLKDLKKGVEGNLSGGTPVENDVALGTGQLDIPAIIAAAKKANVEHFYLEDESPIYYKQIPQSMEYLKSLKK